MLLIKLRDRHREHVISAGKSKAIHIFEGKEDRGILISPSLTQRRIFLDLQPVKNLSAVHPDIKKISQHAHSQGLPKTPRPGDQRHLRPCRLQKLADQRGLIHIIIIVFPDFRKI